MMTEQEKNAILQSIDKGSQNLFQALTDFNKNSVREEDYQQLLKDYETLQKEKVDCEKKITSLEDFKNSINKIFDSDDVTEVTEKYVKISESLGNKTQDLKTKQQECTKLSEEKKELVSQRETAKNNLKNLKEILQQKFGFEWCENISDYVTKCDGLLSTHTTGIEKLKNDIGSLRGKIDKFTLDQNKITREKNRYKGECDAWEKATEQYSPLFVAMENCDVVEDLVTGATQAEKILSIVANVGRGQDFLKDVYERFRKKKKKDIESLSVEELEFFEAVNSFCREHFSKDFDVFQAPDGAIREFHRVEFNKEKMKNVKDEKKDNLNNAVKLCVPMLMALETGKMYFHALVEASN